MLNIALLQCRPFSNNTSAALRRLASAAAEAAEKGADILLLPEMFISGYAIGRDTVSRLATGRDGSISERVATIAAQNNIAICYGYPETAQHGSLFNAANFICPSRGLLGHYRKTHLFGDIDREQFSASDSCSPVVEFKGWRLAIAICYDVEFPEWIRLHALKDIDVLLVPTANMHPYSSVCTRIVPARAQENAIVIAYCNYCGEEGELKYCGLSCVCDGGGEDLARAGHEEELLFASVTRDALQQVRASSHYLQDRRPALYGPLQLIPQ